MVSTVVYFLKICITYFGVITMCNYFKQAQSQSENDEEKQVSVKVDLSKQKLILIDERILGLYDPVLVLEPGKNDKNNDKS